MIDSNLVWACVGFVICMIIFTVISILILCVIWLMFRTDKDFDFEFDDWEE